jgi:hypothetical protein
MMQTTASIMLANKEKSVNKGGETKANAGVDFEWLC